MSDTCPFSIVITNYNYAKFLRAAIDSALSQTLPNVEVIVVDDGSTDESASIMREYGDKIVPVYKENGGQASAFNVGFARSSGALILFLDSDDQLFPEAAERLAAGFSLDSIIKVATPLLIVGSDGALTGRMLPCGTLPEGNLLPKALRDGPRCHESPPTTGNAWRRSYLDRILPMPEQPFRICADTYLFTLTPLFGDVKALPESVGLYRVHGNNGWANASIVASEKSIERYLDLFESRCAILEQRARPQHLADASIWLRRDFGHVILALLGWRLFGMRWRVKSPADLIRHLFEEEKFKTAISRAFKILFILYGPLFLVRYAAKRSFRLKTRTAPQIPRMPRSEKNSAILASCES